MAASIAPSRSPLVHRALAALLAVTAACAAAPARAAALEGVVRVVEPGGPGRDVHEALIWWVPERGARPGPPVTATIHTRNREFTPRTLAVPPGSTVRFPNGDPIRHNVFSVSAPNRFDLGLYGPGAGRAQVLAKPGLVRIFCNVHRQMAAWVMVLETPHHTTAAADGGFRLDGLPAGAGTLHVWHPRASAWERALALPAAAVDVALEATLPAVPPHLDKFGRPYETDERRDAYR